MADAMDQLVEYQHRVDEWLLDWRSEIEAVERYARVPVNPSKATEIAAEHVVPRFGAELTVMARYAKHRYEGHRKMKALSGPDEPDVLTLGGQAWGARDALALGLGVHLGLSVEHAGWLAAALVGYEMDWPALDKRRNSS